MCLELKVVLIISWELILVWWFVIVLTSECIR